MGSRGPLTPCGSRAEPWSSLLAYPSADGAEPWPSCGGKVRSPPFVSLHRERASGDAGGAIPPAATRPPPAPVAGRCAPATPRRDRRAAAAGVSAASASPAAIRPVAASIQSRHACHAPRACGCGAAATCSADTRPASRRSAASTASAASSDAALPRTGSSSTRCRLASRLLLAMPAARRAASTVPRLRVAQQRRRSRRRRSGHAPARSRAVRRASRAGLPDRPQHRVEGERQQAAAHGVERRAGRRSFPRSGRAAPVPPAPPRPASGTS